MTLARWWSIYIGELRLTRVTSVRTMEVAGVYTPNRDRHERVNHGDNQQIVSRVD